MSDKGAVVSSKKHTASKSSLQVAGMRPHPANVAVSGPKLPVNETPMICYPPSTLMLAGIRVAPLTSTQQDMPCFEQLLGDGSNWELNISHAVQPSAGDLAPAFVIRADFVGAARCALILGENILHGSDLAQNLNRASTHSHCASVFAYRAKDSERVGAAELDAASKVISVEERPAQSRSRLAVTGLYFYDNRVVEIAPYVNQSARGELEITDVNRVNLECRELSVEVFGRGVAWLDTGTHKASPQASNFVATLEKRRELKNACPEEAAYRVSCSDPAKLAVFAAPLDKSGYGQYLSGINREQGDAHV